MPSYDCALHALRSWLDSWAGIVTEVTQSLKEGLSQARVSARVELQEAYSRDLRRLLRLILLRARSGAEWSQGYNDARGETATRYHRASSGAPERIVSR
jgi:hypothetical protein